MSATVNKFPQFGRNAVCAERALPDLHTSGVRDVDVGPRLDQVPYGAPVIRADRDVKGRVPLLVLDNY